jgi:hypothetical protein
MDMSLSKASEGGFIGNGWVSGNLTFCEVLLWWGMTVPIRSKVRPESFQKGIPMSILVRRFAISRSAKER